MFRPLLLALLLFCAVAFTHADDTRLRLIVETDAGGDPDDEQSLVRLLVYASEFDIEGLIANRPRAIDGENRNPIRDGLGIVRAEVNAYAECYPNLIQHDPHFPPPAQLLARTVAGYDDTDDGVNLIIRAVDAPDPRPVWFSNWGTNEGSAVSCLQRALDRVLRERGPEGYAKFKSRLRLCSADKFGDHTGRIDPPFPIFIDASRPELNRQRWYHRFSPLTKNAGGFDLERDVRTGHGPLGPLYPTNTHLPSKEGDTMYFLYLLPTGLNDPMHPDWGSWGGRHVPHGEFPGKPYWWATVEDTWHGTTSRDNTLARWAEALQNDFAARMDWCVADTYAKANHRPIAILNGDASQNILHLTTKPSETVKLTATGTRDPDGNTITTTWFPYPESGTYRGEIRLSATNGDETSLPIPTSESGAKIHVILEVRDNGQPNLCAYRRAVVTVK